MVFNATLINIVLPVSLDCPFLIALYILSDVYVNFVTLLWYSISKALQSFIFVLYNFNIDESGVDVKFRFYQVFSGIHVKFIFYQVFSGPLKT
jgi:hypothetical protein